MARIILLVALFLALYYVVRQIASSWRTQNKTASAQQKLVQCSSCGLHVPEAESTVIHGQYYCSNPECNPESSQNPTHDE